MKSAPANHDEVLQRAQAGDPDAFHALVEPHLPVVRRIALAFSRNRSDADDLAQDAILKAYRSIAAYRGDGNIGPWLFTVTRNVCHDAYRRAKARGIPGEVVLDEERELSSGDDPLVLLEAKSDAERLWDAIRNLEAKFRVALVLFEIEGLSYEDVARIERVPVGTVRSRLSRARAQLSRALEEPQPVPSGPPASQTNPGTFSLSRASSPIRASK